MKLGIITEFSLNTVNYGNHLQAYALNEYLSRKYPEMTVETIVLAGREKRRYTSIYYWARHKILTLLSKCKHVLMPIEEEEKIETRFQKFLLFAQEYINYTIGTWPKLVNSDYDYFVVGSDVVWFQWPGYVKRVKFLGFKNRKNAIKISYAPSFGKNFIPSENIKLIRKYLSDFKAISVRECASVELLASIGIDSVVHVCDPTILLRREDWVDLERTPLFEEEVSADVILQRGFCFAYLLGSDEKQRKKIEAICDQENIYLVTIPYTSGYVENENECFGDIMVNDCSPQEWLWLIHHARYVITDSFHGLAFSTIFLTKFIIIRRSSSLDLSMRLLDYLAYLNESNKYMDIDNVGKLSEYNWNFSEIAKKQTVLRRESERYLNDSIEIKSIFG